MCNYFQDWLYWLLLSLRRPAGSLRACVVDQPAVFLFSHHYLLLSTSVWTAARVIPSYYYYYYFWCVIQRANLKAAAFSTVLFCIIIVIGQFFSASFVVRKRNCEKTCTTWSAHSKSTQIRKQIINIQLSILQKCSSDFVLQFKWTCHATESLTLQVAISCPQSVHHTSNPQGCRDGVLHVVGSPQTHPTSVKSFDTLWFGMKGFIPKCYVSSLGHVDRWRHSNSAVIPYV